MLACTVRGCGEPLEQFSRALACRRGHSFDLARAGYINLLQPQDRRSRDAGDSAETVAARARLWTAGLGRTLADAVIAGARALDLPERAGVVDLGCGGGHLLAALAAERAINGVGIDLSTAAVGHAAHLSPGLTWVVANADRRLPLLDGCASLVVSLHARRNPAECFRVLSPAGRLLVAVPAADDLIELRTLVQGQGTARARGDALIAAHAELFTVVHEEPVRSQDHVSAEILRDLLRVTYRGRRYNGRPFSDDLRDMDLTMASDLVVFAPRR